jgi:hypothetical protein
MRLISVQANDDDQLDTVEQQAKRMRRHRRDELPASGLLDVLFAVAKDDASYYKPTFVRRRLETSIDILKRALDAQVLMLKTETCRRDLCVRGDCRDTLTVSDTTVSSVTSITTARAFISPLHTRTYQCLCADGYGGAKCNIAVDACSRQPCSSRTQMCVPMQDTVGYTCVCEEGR